MALAGGATKPAASVLNSASVVRDFVIRDLHRRFEASAEPHHISYCHCGDCRRASGAPVSAFVGFMADQVALNGKSLKSYRNGPVERSFCGICGSPIAYVDQRLDNRIYFMLGAMDMPAYFRPTLPQKSAASPTGSTRRPPVPDGCASSTSGSLGN